MGPWRLIIDGANGGAWNMAVDRAVLEAHRAGDVPATLRLFAWRAPTVSLGRFQRSDDVDLAYCAAHGIELCRRPTGGRGVLHDDELTYSIVAGRRDGLPRGVAASYRMLCGALVEAYRRMGIEAELTARSRGSRHSGACYLHATQADLSLGAAKLSGSAQVWSGDSCLQHGSFVITRDVGREAAVFRLNEVAERELTDMTSTIADAIGARPDLAMLGDAARAGFESVLGVEFVRGELTEAEGVRARELEAEHDIA